MSDPNVRQKVSRILKAMKHKPSVRGGNGHGATLPQRIMHKILGSKWNMEYPLSLGKRIPGYPTHYKLDLANPEKKIAIEVDGFSHRSRKKIDQKKDAKLASFGWKVLRFWNRDILTWNDTVDAEGHIYFYDLGRNTASSFFGEWIAGSQFFHPKILRWRFPKSDYRGLRADSFSAGSARHASTNDYMELGNHS